ncbi:Helicase associated domain protein [Mycobacterium sp. ITM-2016-00316]|uniref:DEAD/DEAH box helicase n=1 Tax=Mycobacterium sp. ITM-2016-00316 TaxID=2099695 RepID=UPI00115C213D|nr:DEAD/DEAH box helicase [Mycobacterium sp. ITM-2016-00316]WNG83730.1 Helicase associated domain protein [Mycobacterium sp. ITM-2016-00316]
MSGESAMANGFTALYEQLGIDPKKKGTQFERIVKFFLENDPYYAHELVRVDLWKDSPHKWGTKDLGTDLIAVHRDGGLWSIQAKAYGPNYRITKRDVDSWLSDSNRPEVTYRLLVATTNRIGGNAESTIKGQAIKVGTRLRTDLEEADVTWPSSLEDLRTPKPKPKAPLPHQVEAVTDVVNEFQVHDRGQLISATGTGKTLTALFISEKLEARRVLVLEPSIALVGQNLGAFMTNKTVDFTPVVVASEVSEGDDVRVSDLGLPVTTNPEVIAAELRTGASVTVFSTLHSSPEIAAAFRLGNVPEFDLVIVDEAHHLALQADSRFATVLDDKKIPAKKRLFMTATPKTYDLEKVLEPALKAGVELASMDDVEKFGRVFHELSFGEAIKRRLLSDYQIIIVGVTKDDPVVRKVLLDETNQGRFITLDGANVKPDEPLNMRSVGGQIALIRAMRKHGLHRVAAFHSLVKRSREWADSLTEVNHWMPADQRIDNLSVAHLSSANSAFERQQVLTALRSPGKDTYAVVSNVRLFGEGVDVPNLNAVAIIDPKGSEIDIIQTVGRVLRLDRNDPDKIGTIVLPVFVDATDDDPVSAIANSLYEPIHRVLMVLRNEDERFAEEINMVRLRLGAQRGGYKRTIGLSHVAEIDIPAITEDILQAFEARLVERLYSSFSFWVDLIKEYKQEFGNTNIPTRVDGAVFRYRGHALGNVTNIFRTWAKNGKLSAERIAQLDALQFQWAPFDELWEEGLLRAVGFHNEHGIMPTSGPDARWLQLQRSAKNLEADRRERLDKELPGWALSARDVKWDANRQEALKFAMEHGHANIPQDYAVGGVNVGSWVSTQRINKDRLGSERIALLEEIPGWTWDGQLAKWMEMFDKLSVFEKQHGHTSIPRDYPDKKLMSWVKAQRKRWRNGVLGEERIKLLNSLNTWEWQPKGRGLIAT